MEIRPVRRDVWLPFVLRGHYAKRCPQVRFAYGLFDGEACVGVVTFGEPASPWVKRSPCGRDWERSVVELNRLVITSPERNAASFLVGSALRMLGDWIVVSYADVGAGHVGYVYQATNWIYCGCSKPRTDKMSVAGHSRHYEPGETRRVQRTAKHRYVRFVGQGRFVKSARKSLLWVPQPYPKGATRRHAVERVRV